MPLDRESVRREVRSARRLLAGAATIRQVSGRECLHRSYNRLNSDYRSLHSLCRFFLTNTGPGIERGDNQLIPFTVDMPGLFELFVAEWLKGKAPPDMAVKAQHKARLDSDGAFAFRMDVVLFGRTSKTPLSVLDTKYKAGDTVAESDIQQVVAYAVKLGAANAFLVYPSSLDRGLDIVVGPVRVRSIAFSLDGDLDVAGSNFLHALAA